MFIELELKMTADETFDPEQLLAALREVATVGPPAVKIMRDAYLDTRSRCLARAGLSGRWRRVGRAGSLQIKPVLLIPQLVLERVELGVQLDRGRDPARTLKSTAQRQLGARLRGLPVPEVELRSRREVYVVQCGDCAAELSIDRSTALLPGRRSGVPFMEVELELASGPREDFERMVQALAQVPGLSPSGKSKHRRALELLGLPVLRLAAPAPTFDASSTTDEVARQVCLTQWHNVRAFEPGTRLSLDPEYLHKMRVSTRRLRAALRTFEDCFTLRDQRYLQGNLRWLAAVLGQVRDMDVQLLQLAQRQRELGSEPDAGWRQLRDALRRRREVALTELRSELDSDRYQRLCARAPQVFARAPRRYGGHPGAAPVSDHGEELVATRGRQFFKAARRVRRDPVPLHVHALRIRGKKLRYTCEFFAPLYSPEYRAGVKRLCRFQDVLGLFNDNVVSGELARSLRQEALTGATEATGEYLYVLGLLDAASRLGAESARSEVRGALKRLGGPRAVEALAREAAAAASQQRKQQRKLLKRQRKAANKADKDNASVSTSTRDRPATGAGDRRS